MSETQIKMVKCPNCQTPVPWLATSKYRPFCSERCKLMDLGEWASESYKVPASPPDSSELDVDGLPRYD